MEKILAFDKDLLIQIVEVIINMGILFTILSFLLFEPVKKVLAKRAEKIKNDIESAEKDKADSAALKAEYEMKLKDIQKEADQIIATAHKKANTRHDEIINKAKEEANRIVQNANREAELEKEKARDELKAEMVDIADAIARKFVSVSLDDEIQGKLIEETLKEMGDETWQN